MKKLAVLAAVVVVAALAAPAFSATNPFMDVPMNHWAYDAIGQLYAHDVMKGYDDGLFKGNQAATRYELASSLARALAVVDWTKASKQDVEMLKRLVVEFKDELESLGVRVDELDERVAVFENRLGGWHIHGTLVLDVTYQDGNDKPEGGALGKVGFDEARINFKRTWGENDEYFFHARLRDESGGNGRFDRFYVQMPFYFDSRLSIGRQIWSEEGAYKLSLPETGSWMGDQVLTDWGTTAFMWTKGFGLGNAKLAIAHPDKNPIYGSDWMLYLGSNLQFTEQIGLDIGFQMFMGDNAEEFGVSNTGSVAVVNGQKKHQHGDVSFNNLWTVFAGLHYDFNDKLGVKGIFYHQAGDSEQVDPVANKWNDYGLGLSDGNDLVEDANHWAGIIDVKQEALKFTSLWLEYGMFDKGFWSPNAGSAIFFSGSPVLDRYLNGNQAIFDTTYYRVGLGQEWTDKLATHIFYYGYKVEEAAGNGGDASPFEVGAVVQYKLNDSTTMGLNYLHVDADFDGTDDDPAEDNLIKFRTAISF